MILEALRLTKIQKIKLNTTIILTIIFIANLIYAYIRYIHFGGILFSSNQIYIINKALAMNAIMSISIAYWISSLSKFEKSKFRRFTAYKRFFGLSGFFFACAHIFLAFRIIEPNNMSVFFEANGDFSNRGYTIIILGVIGYFFLLFPAITSMKEFLQKLNKSRWRFYQRFGYVSLFIILIHNFFIGYNGWISVTQWKGSMPPITLICSIIILSTLSMRIFTLIYLKK